MSAFSAILNEGQVVLERIDAAAATTGKTITTVPADAGYTYGKVYGGLERLGIDPIIPAKAEPIKARVPLRWFRYDAGHDLAKCPRGKVLRSGRPIPHVPAPCSTEPHSPWGRRPPPASPERRGFFCTIWKSSQGPAFGRH